MPEPNAKKPQSNAALKYTGIATQMALTIGLFVYGGIKLDAHQANKTPVWTLVGSLLGTILAVVNIIRQVTRP